MSNSLKYDHLIDVLRDQGRGFAKFHRKRPASIVVNGDRAALATPLLRDLTTADRLQMADRTWAIESIHEHDGRTELVARRLEEVAAP